MAGTSSKSLQLTESERKCAVIVTALDVETKAVLRQVGSWTDDDVEQGTVFYKGRFEEWDIVVVEAGPGNIAAAALASRAIGRFNASVALFVGVGGGFKDVALGDVVVATKVYGYEGGKDTATGFRSRPDLQHSAHALEQRARALCKRNGWKKRLNQEINRMVEPALFVGPVAAGEKVIASTKSKTAKFLRENYGDTLAVEMEGKGFLEAVHINQIVGTVVRGISDLLSKKTVSDGQGWQRIAADAASAVAFELLATLEPKPASGGGAAPTDKLPTTEARKPEVVEQPPRSALHETAHTLNRGAYFTTNQVLARVGVEGVDEVLFSYQELPDAYLRVIRAVGPAKPISISQLKDAANFAPLLKLSQYGCFSDVNEYGVVAYDPGGPHRGGPAPLSWATQLFPKGELWLMSNTMIVRERGPRPQWVPVPFIPALSFEKIFFDKLRAAIAFAVQHLGVRFPCYAEMGLLGTMDVTLAIDKNDMRQIRSKEIVTRLTLPNSSNEAFNEALLSFFNNVYDATGYPRPASLFNFPPGPPTATVAD